MRHNAAMKPFRVLIVEDHELFRRTLRRFLESRYPDIQVLEAENGKLATEVCQTDAPDLVVMDIQMPECDGLTAARVIKEADNSLPIVLYSAEDLPFEHQSPADTFIDKQFVFERLPEEVARLLPEVGEAIGDSD